MRSAHSVRLGSKLFAALLASLASAVVACGGESSNSGGSCGAASSCGGDLTGVWHVTGLCASIPPAFLQAQTSRDAGASVALPAECADALSSGLGSVKSTPQNATLEFTSDGQYKQAGSVAISISFTFTGACLRALHAPAASDAVCAQASRGVMSGGLSGSCHVAGDGCGCSATLSQAFNQMGPYSVQGSTLTLDSKMPGAPYCVQGSTATISANVNGATARVDLSR